MGKKRSILVKNRVRLGVDSRINSHEASFVKNIQLKYVDLLFYI